MIHGGTREAEFAGILYPGDEKTLLRFLERVMLDALPPDHARQPERRLVSAQGVFLAHGPYVYSAECAAQTLTNVEIPTTALILHPRTITSRAYGKSGLPLSAITSHAAWETPFGKAMVNQKLARELIVAGVAKIDDTIEEGEHAGEVVIPLLQMLNRELEVCVLSLGDGSAADSRRLGKGIAEALPNVGEESVLIVGVSDFHFGADRMHVEREDDYALEQIERMSSQGLIEVVKQRSLKLSGTLCIAAMMEAGRELGCSEMVVQSHTDSGDISGDHDDVAGYASGWMV